MDGFGDGNHGHCRSEHVLDGTEARNARPSKLEIEDISCIWRYFMHMEELAMGWNLFRTREIQFGAIHTDCNDISAAHRKRASGLNQ